MFSLTGKQGLTQRNCGTMEADSLLRLKYPNLGSLMEFEAKLQKFIKDKKNIAPNAHIYNGVYTIPVVFHVIHNGEAEGSGNNISYNRLLDQLNVLNQDFRRMIGTNGYNTHPDGADTKIEFCLARRRPDGSPFPGGQNGVNRINATAQGWGTGPFTTAFVDGTIKPYTTVTQGYDATIYMNFWCVNLGGGLLGYAQFPQTSLGGLDCNPGPITTDGVVMLSGSVGGPTYPGTAPGFDIGRTATHEIGHWLGLRHIWGDATCGDDFCADTPVHETSNSGCPSHPKSNACGTPDEMFENYMDYCDDICLNIFTNDQAIRMRTVLENFRWSLVNSTACMPPATNDASVLEIIAPVNDICSSTITPIVRIKNHGTAVLNTVTIESKIDNGTPVTQTFTSLGLASLASTNLTLNPVTGITTGVHTFEAKTLLPNGVADPFTTYDASNTEFTRSTGSLPIIEDFEDNQFVP
ncbi:MAG: zinc metalloprotease, partial [Bacteroidia bacterium]|nr:zinc metalloprotease [Bacteroidia bacterium]